MKEKTHSKRRTSLVSSEEGGGALLQEGGAPKPMMKRIVRKYFATKRQDLTWDDADAACAAEKEGGKLAIVTNHDDQKKIFRTWRKGRDEWAPKKRRADCDQPWSPTRKTPRCWGEDEYTQWIGLHRKEEFRNGSASPDKNYNKNFNNMWEWYDGYDVCLRGPEASHALAMAQVRSLPAAASTILLMV